MGHNNQVYCTNNENGSGTEPAQKKSRTGEKLSTSHHQPLNRTEIIIHAAVLMEKLSRKRDEQKAQLLAYQHHAAAVTTQTQGGNMISNTTADRGADHDGVTIIATPTAPPAKNTAESNAMNVSPSPFATVLPQQQQQQQVR